MSAKTAMSAKWTVNDILRHFGPAYLAKYEHRMSLDQIKTLRALSLCRAIEAGSIVARCKDCQRTHQFPKSCGNRHCPSCQGEKAKQWLADQQARLLPCAYFMVTFTIPAKLRRFVRSHPRECYQALFEAARRSTVKLAKDSKYLGSGKLGMTGVLHTWGRDLNYHPHVHFIIPGGAISKSGTEWLSSRSDFLVPVKALSKIFRAKFRELMRRCDLLGSIDPAVWHEPWIVNSQAVGDGRSSLRYLAPYVFRVAIGNFRIVSVRCHTDRTGQVTFLVKPSGSRRYRRMTVTAEEFLRRFLQHVLPSGFQKVRHYGYMHKRSKVSATWLNMLVTVTLNMVYQLIVTTPVFQPKRAMVCPDCGGELQYLGWLRPLQALPFKLDSS